jgi:hypothetical protein
MKRLQHLFIFLLVAGNLGIWTTDTNQVAAQQKDQTSSVSATTRQQRQIAAIAPTPKKINVMREYRSIRLTMHREEVRDALGKPELTDKEKDRFKIGGDDRLTVHYENDRVKTIQLYFLESKNAPSWTDVIGDAEIEQRPDGSKLTRVVINEEKFWVSMYQSKSGDITTITISGFSH